MPDLTLETLLETFKAVISNFREATDYMPTKFSQSNEFIFFVGSLHKISLHGESALKLATEIHLQKFPEYRDFVSIQVLARSVVETAGMFKHVWIDSEGDKKDFLINYIEMYGLQNRSNYSAIWLNDESHRKLEDEAHRIEELKNLLQTFDFYKNNLTEGQRKNVLKGKYLIIERKESLTTLGFVDHTSQTFYRVLSDFSHSSFLSLMQVSQATDQVSNRLAKSSLTLIAVSQAVILRELSKTYPQLEEFIGGHSQLLMSINVLHDFVGAYW